MVVSLFLRPVSRACRRGRSGLQANSQRYVPQKPGPPVRALPWGTLPTRTNADSSRESVQSARGKLRARKSALGATLDEEAEGYLDHLLARPVARLPWLAGRLAVS